jgi:glycosyltransferase involved in cell wall biosynthesis
MHPETVDILLPTYNGSEYIKDLMDSLCRQSCNRFSVLTYDDGSTDDTISHVDTYRNRLSINRIDNPDGSNMGALRSFELLMKKSTAECIMFCDQDDIWAEKKVEKLLSAFNLQKKRFGDIPLLVFSDLSLITDDSDSHTGNSFLTYQGINTRCMDDPYYLVFRNPAPGCSMLINRALAEASLPIGDTAVMHDWWIIINAAIKGEIFHIPDQLVRYRVHTSNTLGIIADVQYARRNCRQTPASASVNFIFSEPVQAGRCYPAIHNTDMSGTVHFSEKRKKVLSRTVLDKNDPRQVSYAAPCPLFQMGGKILLERYKKTIIFFR